jgi:nicotinamidase-related amidase
MNIALLIIDVQQALCSGEYEAFDARRVIDRINQVSRLARGAWMSRVGASARRTTS